MMLRLILVITLLVGTYAGVPHLLRPVPSLLPAPEPGRIVGGEETTIEKVPHVVAMLVSGRHWCGGSIIKADVVLTAAHCLEIVEASVVSIRAGSTYKSSGGQVIGLTKHVIHPKYNISNWLCYDTGVMLLASPITLGETAKIIPMIAQGGSVPDGTQVRVSGWGSLMFNPIYFPEVLQTVLVRIVSQEVCKTAYAGTIISDDMLCAGIVGEGGKDACRGDSGGPLVSENDNILVGIVSWSYRCATPTHPGIYTRVASIRDWVDTFLK